MDPAVRVEMEGMLDTKVRQEGVVREAAIAELRVGPHKQFLPPPSSNMF